MATDLLVDDRIQAGRQLVDALMSSEFDVTAACWIKPVEEERWLLYVSSKFVDEKGPLAAYREVSRVFKGGPEARDLMADLHLVGRDTSIARDILTLRESYPARIPSWAQRSMIGNVAADEIYIYPTHHEQGSGLRQSFRVVYCRQGDTDQWNGETTQGRLYRDLEAKGAVSYSTAHWEGDGPGRVLTASVSVLLEVDPLFDRDNFVIHPDVRQLMADQAREMADRMFKEKHPDAVIEHDLEVKE